MSNKNWNEYWGKTSELDYWRIPALEVINFIENQANSTRKKVLDLGCGIGRHSIAFAEKGFDVLAVDQSEIGLNELERISDNYKLNIRTHIGDFNKKLFELSTFDIVISYNVLYHGTKSQFKSSIEYCHDYLKKDGLFFFTCPTRVDGKYGSGEKIEEHTYASLNSVHSGDIHYFSSSNDIDELMSNFEVLSKEKKEHEWINGKVKQFSSYWIVIGQKK